MPAADGGYAFFAIAGRTSRLELRPAAGVALGGLRVAAQARSGLASVAAGGAFVTYDAPRVEGEDGFSVALSNGGVEAPRPCRPHPLSVCLIANLLEIDEAVQA